MLLLKAWPWGTDIYYSYQLYVACATTFVLVYVLGLCGKVSGALWAAQYIVILQGPCEANGNSQVFVKLHVKSCLLKEKNRIFLSDFWWLESFIKGAIDEHHVSGYPLNTSWKSRPLACFLLASRVTFCPCGVTPVMLSGCSVIGCSVICAQADAPVPAEKPLQLRGALQRGAEAHGNRYDCKYPLHLKSTGQSFQLCALNHCYLFFYPFFRLSFLSVSLVKHIAQFKGLWNGYFGSAG